MVQPGCPIDHYCLIFNGCDRATPLYQEYRPVGEINYHNRDFSTMTAELNLKIASSERDQGDAHEAMR